MSVVILVAVLVGLGAVLYFVLKASTKHTDKIGAPRGVSERIERPDKNLRVQAPPVEEQAIKKYVCLYSFTPRPVGWRCPTCDVENPVNAQECPVCGQARPVNSGRF